MSTFTTFAVAGVGNIGSGIVDELLKKNFSVTILTRDDTKPELQDFKIRGAALAKVDYTDHAGLTKALASVEVVVTAFSVAVHEEQKQLARAAKDAGVELFVPTEYGIKKPVDSPIGAANAVVRAFLKEIDMPYAAFYNGWFYEYASIGLKHNYEEGKVQIVGDGNYPLSLTSIKEIGVFVAHALSRAAKDDLKWAEIPFEGDRKTPLEIVAIAEKKYGKKFEVEYVDVEENKKLMATDFNAILVQFVVDGLGVSGTEEAVAAAKAKFFPEWNPTPYEELILSVKPYAS